MRPKVYKLRNFEILGRRRPPGGFQMVQKWFSDSTSSYFMLHLIKNINIITVKYAQKYFEITLDEQMFHPKILS